MSLLMEALRKAEQGKCEEGDAVEAAAALVPADEEQPTSLEAELLNLDLPDDLDKTVTGANVYISEDLESVAAASEPLGKEPPAGARAGATDESPIHLGGKAEHTPEAASSMGAVPFPTALLRESEPRKPQLREDESDPMAGAATAEKADMAEILFQAKRGKRKEWRLTLILVILVPLCLAALGGWYYFILEEGNGQFQPAGFVATVSPAVETELVSPPGVIPASAQHSPTVAGVSETTATEEQQPAGGSTPQVAKSALAEATNTVPASRPEKEKAVEAVEEVADQDNSRAPQRPSSKSAPAPVAKSKAPVSVQAAYQRAMDQQAQTAGKAPIEIRRSRKQLRRSLPLNEAWKAFNEHRYQDADVLYQAIMEREPFNRDALLGRAAVAMRGGRVEQAHNAYLKLLERDPRDPLALAGLIALRGQQQPNQSLARLRQLIAANPDISGLHFVLGNLYAGQSRWAYAQQAYFKAYADEPGHPEYLFNLAVSLDHLGKKAQSLQFYRLALQQAKEWPVKFSVDAVNARIEALEAGA